MEGPFCVRAYFTTCCGCGQGANLNWCTSCPGWTSEKSLGNRLRDVCKPGVSGCPMENDKKEGVYVEGRRVRSL